MLRNKYSFKKYSKKYSQYFQKELKQLRIVFGAKAHIEHIGSTSIPKLGGKGIVDVVVGVRTKDLERYIVPLEKADYIYRKCASSKERIFFRRDYQSLGKARRVHVHLVKYNSKDWKEMITFRDYLLSHPEEVKEYEQLKKEAAKKSKGDGTIYKRIKDQFISKIL